MEETSDSGLEVGWYAELHKWERRMDEVQLPNDTAFTSLSCTVLNATTICFQVKNKKQKNKVKVKKIHFIAQYYVECLPC